MAKPLVQTAGRSREVADVKVVELYEPDTGNVVHMHTVVAFKGGRILSEKEAIEEALEHPREIDQHLREAQEARRVLDRLVGYDLSGLIWKKVR